MKQKLELLLLFTMLLFCSCKTQKKLSPEEKVEQEVRNLSAPLIARDFVTLESYLEIAKDTTLPHEKRDGALGDAQEQFPGYMHSLGLDNINTPEGQEIIKEQKELITNTYRLQAAKQVRAQALEDVIKAGGDPQ